MLGSTVRDPRDAVIDYHEASKHHLDRYAPGPGGLDWATQPDPFRSFAGAAKTPLPLAADALDTRFVAVRRGERALPRPLSLATLATLLELSLGLSAWKQHGASRWALRCNPSSGNLHPTEGYVVCAALDGLAAGVHHYLSRDHALEHRARAADPAWGRELGTALVVGLAGIHWREAWKYGLRAWRYCQHDCGHAVGAVAYAAAALGWHARVLDWGDDALAALLGLDRAGDFEGAELESPEVAIAVSPSPIEGRWPVSGRALAGGLSFAGRANRLSPSRREWRGIDDVDRAARRDDPREPAVAAAPAGGDPAGDVAPPLPALLESASDATAARLVRQRRSAVDFDAITTLGADRWLAMLDALLPRPGVPPLDAWPRRPRVHLALFVHRVDGVDPGLYLLARDGTAVPRLRSAMRAEFEWSRVEVAPAHLPLFRLATGDARDVARTVSCHQDIAADSCFALGFLADFADSLAHDASTYRELFWETGLLGQLLYLEAEAAGVRATGIGCFFDDAMHRLLGLADRRWQSLYHFTVGGALDDPRLQTHPPYRHLRR